MTQYDSISEEYSQMLNPTKKYVTLPSFQKITPNVKNKSVLDLGCGDGFFTRLLAKQKPSEIIGVDISQELINKAVEKENQHNLHITYLAEDVLKLKLNKKFNIITSVYLLNYSKTLKELDVMCKVIYSHLNENGTFSFITLNPSLKPMKDFEYERRFTNLNGNSFFKDGDQVKCEMNEKGKTPFSFVSYYWSKETYESCLKKAGFKSIKWIDTIVSQEGINEYGKEYWKKFLGNPSPIGLICKK